MARMACHDNAVAAYARGVYRVVVGPDRDGCIYPIDLPSGTLAPTAPLRSTAPTPSPQPWTVPVPGGRLLIVDGLAGGIVAADPHAPHQVSAFTPDDGVLRRSAASGVGGVRLPHRPLARAGDPAPAPVRAQQQCPRRPHRHPRRAHHLPPAHRGGFCIFCIGQEHVAQRKDLRHESQAPAFRSGERCRARRATPAARLTPDPDG